MKVNVNYYVVHEAIEKLENGDALNDKEKQDVLAVLRAVQGDYIPTREELERQERNIRFLDLYNPESDGFNRIYEQVLEFEKKYC